MEQKTQGKRLQNEYDKIGLTITRMKRHVRANPISVEDYLGNGISKAKRRQTDDELNELTDCFAHLQTHEHTNEMEMKGKDAEARMIQSPKYTNAEHTETIKQSCNRTKDRQEQKKLIKKTHSEKIGIVQQETRETLLVLGYNENNQVEMFTSRNQWRLCYYQDTVMLIN